MLQMLDTVWGDLSRSFVVHPLEVACRAAVRYVCEVSDVQPCHVALIAGLFTITPSIPCCKFFATLLTTVFYLIDIFEGENVKKTIQKINLEIKNFIHSRGFKTYYPETRTRTMVSLGMEYRGVFLLACTERIEWYLIPLFPSQPPSSLPISLHHFLIQV